MGILDDLMMGASLKNSKEKRTEQTDMVFNVLDICQYNVA